MGLWACSLKQVGKIMYLQYLQIQYKWYAICFVLWYYGQNNTPLFWLVTLRLTYLARVAWSVHVIGLWEETGISGEKPMQMQVGQARYAQRDTSWLASVDDLFCCKPVNFLLAAIILFLNFKQLLLSLWLSMLFQSFPTASYEILVHLMNYFLNICCDKHWALIFA